MRPQVKLARFPIAYTDKRATKQVKCQIVFPHFRGYVCGAFSDDFSRLMIPFRHRAYMKAPTNPSTFNVDHVFLHIASREFVRKTNVSLKAISAGKVHGRAVFIFAIT